MRFTFGAQGVTREMNPIVRDEVFRIGSEAIRNAFLHSEGSELEVTLSYARDLTVRVRDNGKGIPKTLPQTANQDISVFLECRSERFVSAAGSVSLAIQIPALRLSW